MPNYRDSVAISLDLVFPEQVIVAWEISKVYVEMPDITGMVVLFHITQLLWDRSQRPAASCVPSMTQVTGACCILCAQHDTGHRGLLHLVCPA